MERRSMLENICSSNMNFYQNFKLSGHWDEKCWRLHLELHSISHTNKRRGWRVKSKEDEEFIASLAKEEEVIQGFISTQELNLNNEASSCLMEVGESREGYQAWVDISFTTRWFKNDLLVDGLAYQ
jgi:hypothetical protein